MMSISCCVFLVLMLTAMVMERHFVKVWAEELRKLHRGRNNEEVPEVSRNQEETLPLQAKPPSKDEISWIMKERLRDNGPKSILKRTKPRRRGRKLPANVIASPPGPQGPPGLPGPPGGFMSVADLEVYISDFLEGFMENLVCKPKIAETHSTDDEEEDVIIEEEEENEKKRLKYKRPVPAAVVSQLFNSVFHPAFEGSVPIQNFTVIFAPEFYRKGVMMEGGGFTVAKAGIYQVSATVILTPKGDFSVYPILEDTVKIYVSVSSMRKEDRRIQWIGDVDRTTTAVLTGHVLLQRRQTVYVALDNESRRSIKVLPGSTFSLVWIASFKNSQDFGSDL